jgi:hypothetical protein
MKKQRLNVKQMFAVEAANVARQHQSQIKKSSMNKETKPKVDVDPSKPRTLQAAKDRIAELEAQLGKQKLPSNIEPASVTTLRRPIVEKVVAAVKSKAANLDSVSLASIQEQLDATTDADARIALLAKAANDFKARIAANKNDMSAESQELYKAKAKIERRHAYELLAAGKLRDAYRIRPEDLA